MSLSSEHSEDRLIRKINKLGLLHRISEKISNDVGQVCETECSLISFRVSIRIMKDKLFFIQFIFALTKHGYQKCLVAF